MSAFGVAALRAAASCFTAFCLGAFEVAGFRTAALSECGEAARFASALYS